MGEPLYNFRQSDIASTSTAIQVNRLRKSYKDVVALDDVSLTIPVGQAVAVIGPNGAGKTTLVEIISNLRQADSGTVYINGTNLRQQPGVIRDIGIQLQEAHLFPMVRVSRYFKLFSHLYGAPPPSPELIGMLGLTDHVNKRYSELSGGLRQRFLLALALLNDPKILILDEPTTGLDPIAREELWAFVETWRKAGERTVLLTSHFMDEVERLCERVVVLSKSRIVADGDVPTLLNDMPADIKTLQSAYGRLVNAEEFQ